MTETPEAPLSLDRFEAAGDHPAPPGRGEIHVWTIPLDPPAAEVEALRRLLAGDERARAERFRFERHRRRYAVGRGALRTLLGRYLGVDPRDLAFRYGPNEKPYLAPSLAAGAGGLEFNLSNSDELAVVAFTTGAELGADVERLRPMPDALDIAERFFSVAERRVLAAVPEGDRERTFFRCWTRKEAYLKAVGTGITVPLDRFDVTLAAEDPPRILAMEGDPEKAAAWTLAHLEPRSGYLGALAIQARPRRLDGFRWRP
jgi:4'-phosphopantetheinyl transferase